MITPEIITEIECRVFDRDKTHSLPHEKDCAILDLETLKCTCIYGIARELVHELKKSLSREKKKREEVSRFASKLTEWIEEQIA